MAEHTGNRYGRSEAARRAVLEAADDLLAERGFAGVTIEGIASRAGVAKQTIYRWWSSKAEVLMDAFAEDAAEDLAPPDRGSLATDLTEHLARLAGFLGCSDAGRVFVALIGQAQHDAGLAATFRARWLDAQRERDRLPLERAVARGELPAGLDLDVELDQLLGPIYYRLLVTGDAVSPEFVARLVGGFLGRVARGDPE